ncbi:MAG: hypothetical protein HY646_21620, partial [Acidobacteria bacterium]|nr:hypothetical protein [Acidobacteriota bacterium]
MTFRDIATPSAPHRWLVVDIDFNTGWIRWQREETNNEYIAWSHPALGPFHPSALVYRGRYYTLHDRGFLTCNDPQTGKEIYPRQREARGITKLMQQGMRRLVRIEEAQGRTDARLAESQERTDARFRELAEEMKALAKAQKVTERTLQAFIKG